MPGEITNMNVNITDDDLVVCANCGNQFFFEGTFYVKFQPPIIGQGPQLAKIQGKVILVCTGCGHPLPTDIGQIKTRRDVSKVVPFSPAAGN